MERLYTRRGCLRLMLLAGVAGTGLLAKPAIDGLSQLVQVPDKKTTKELSYNEVLFFLTRVSALLQALPKKQFIKDNKDLQNFANIIKPVYKQLDLIDYEAPLNDIHFQHFEGIESEGLMAHSDCEGKIIYVNDGFINPSSILYARPKLMYEVAHELVHVLGQVCSKYENGSPYQPPPNTETTPTLAALEALAYIRKGNEMGTYGLLGGLQEMGYRTLLYTALKNNTINGIGNDVAQATKDNFYTDDFGRTIKQLSEKPESINSIYLWSFMYGYAVYKSIYSQISDPSSSTIETFKFDPKHNVLNEASLKVPNLVAAYRELKLT